MPEINQFDDIPLHRLVTQVILTPLVFLYMLVGVWIRIYKNYDAAYQMTSYLSRKLRYRIILNSLLIGVYLATIVLSYHFKSFWLSKEKAYSWIFLIAAASIGCETRTIFFSYYRRLTLLKSVHLASWSLILGAEMFASGYCLIFDGIPEMIELVYESTKLVLLLARVVIQLKYPQDRDEFDDPDRLSQELLYSNLEAGLSDSEKNISFLGWRKKIAFERKENAFAFEPTIKKRLDVTAQISKQVTQKSKNRGTGKEFQYQIYVKTFGKQYKVGRSLEEFQKLDKELKNDYSSSILSQQSATGLGSLAVAEDPDSISSSVNILQSFLDGILNSGDPLPMSVVSFLDIPETVRKRVLSWNQLMLTMQDFQISTSVHKSFDDQMQTDSSYPANSEESLKKVAKEIHIDDSDSEGEGWSRGPSNCSTFLADCSMYCPYFQVAIPKWQKATFGDHYEFTIIITHSENRDESWEIVKRYSDFVGLRERLIKEIHGVPPALPAKKVLHDQSVLMKRKNGLENFLRMILNEKLYLQTQCVQDFIKLKKEFMSVVYGDEELQEFDNRRAEVRDNRIILRDDKKAITEFEIKIIEYSRMDPSLAINETKIYRNFKDFEELQSALQDRFSSSSQVLPQLPAKYNEYSGQTKVETIMEGLEKYLNLIFKLPKIGDSFAFRKFVSYSKKFQSFHTGHPKGNEGNKTRRRSTLKDDNDDIDSLKLDSLVKTRTKKLSED